jgi:hypothetical protein
MTAPGFGGISSLISWIETERQGKFYLYRYERLARSSPSIRFWSIGWATATQRNLSLGGLSKNSE